MSCRLALLLFVSATLSIAACKARQDNDIPNPISGSPRSQPIAGNRLTLVREGMTKGQVRNLVGSPQAENRYRPWTFNLPGLSNDTPFRTEWHYEGRGTVVFTETLQKGGTAAVTAVNVVKPQPGMTR
jgi:hypothetical protein